MTNNNFFCSLESKKGNDEQIGTASYIKKLLLIEYKHPFKEEAFKESEIPDIVKQKLQTFLDSNEHSRILLIRNPEEETSETLSIFGINCNQDKTIIQRRELREYEELLDFNLDNLFNTNAQSQTVDFLYLVCTNGTKDKCCSKFGIPIYKEFKIHRPKSTWQCTHLGGDRYAPTMMSFPTCSNYGHIDIADVSNIVNSEEQNQIFLSKLRGQTFLNFYEQAASLFIRKQTSLVNVTDITILNSEKIEDNRFKVTAKNNINQENYSLIISKVKSEYFNYMACTSIRESHSFKYLLDDFATTLN